MKTIDKIFMYSLAALLILAIVGAFVYGIYIGNVPEDIKTALINGFMLVLGFYWGSSSGSKSKDENKALK